MRCGSRRSRRGDRQPLYRQAREPRGALAAAPSSTRPTSGTPRVSRIFARVKPELVFHLAAQIDVRHSVDDPAATRTSNVLGTIAVLEAARAGARRVVISSTGGGLTATPTVADPRGLRRSRPLAPYGQSKYAAEGYCELYARLHGLSTVSLRYGNVYGPRQDVHGEAGVVAIFCGRLIDGRRRLCSATAARRATGSTSSTSPRQPARGRLRRHRPINIGHGQETSVLDLLDALREVGRTGPCPSRIRARAPGRGAAQLPRCAAAREELGWQAAVALRDGLRTILAGLEVPSGVAGSGSSGTGRCGGPSSSAAPLATAQTASPNVDDSATVSTQNVQEPTQLGRHSDARANAVESELRREWLPSSSRTSEKRWPVGSPLTRRPGALAVDPARENEPASAVTQTRSGLPARTSRASRTTHSCSSGVTRTAPNASTACVAASRTCTLRSPRPEAPQMPRLRTGARLTRAPSHAVPPDRRAGIGNMLCVSRRCPHDDVAGAGDKQREDREERKAQRSEEPEPGSHGSSHR